MKTAGYIMGSIEMILGCLILCGTSVMRELLPKLGWIVFQFEGGGYSSMDYEVSFVLATVVAVALLVVGLAQILYFIFKKIDLEEFLW